MIKIAMILILGLMSFSAFSQTTFVDAGTCTGIEINLKIINELLPSDIQLRFDCTQVREMKTRFSIILDSGSASTEITSDYLEELNRCEDKLTDRYLSIPLKRKFALWREVHDSYTLNYVANVIDATEAKLVIEKGIHWSDDKITAINFPICK